MSVDAIEMSATDAVEHVFRIMASTYGAAWDRSMGTAPVADVKTVWADALSDFCHSKEAKRAIMWALKNLPDTVLNARQFRTLCRQAPSREAPALPLPKVNPEIAAKVIDGLKASNPTTGRMDPRAWAKAILANPAGRTPTVIQMAKRAVGEAA